MQVRGCRAQAAGWRQLKRYPRLPSRPVGFRCTQPLASSPYSPLSGGRIPRSKSAHRDTGQVSQASTTASLSLALRSALDVITLSGGHIPRSKGAQGPSRPSKPGFDNRFVITRLPLSPARPRFRSRLPLLVQRARRGGERSGSEVRARSDQGMAAGLAAQQRCTSRGPRHDIKNTPTHLLTSVCQLTPFYQKRIIPSERVENLSLLARGAR